MIPSERSTLRSQRAHYPHLLPLNPIWLYPIFHIAVLNTFHNQNLHLPKSEITRTECEKSLRVSWIIVENFPDIPHKKFQY